MIHANPTIFEFKDAAVVASLPIFIQAARQSALDGSAASAVWVFKNRV